jgi:MoaA/NifB/PqqE/SkfB family radical SAM enzyme
MEKLNKFKNLHFHFSIDGINKTLEYIRWPANWKKVNDNIQTFSKHKAECNITIQAYNIHNLKDFLYWVKSLNTVGLNTVELTQPRWFSYTVLPLDYRNKYLEQLYTDPIMNWSVASESNLKARVETMLNNSEVHNTDLFVQHTKTFDKVRKQYIGDYIPELETIVYG